tara:strand:+ start:2969 stop:4000 length:1032 start_codon:yes stop_codon:yes gene_type:complete
MAKDSIKKEKQNNPNTPGAGLSKSEAAIKKTKEITDKINAITGKVSIGLTYITLGRDGLQTIKRLANSSEEEAYKAKQEIKKQAKDAAWATIQENLPTEQEIIDLLNQKSCDLGIIKHIKKARIKLDNGLNFGKKIAESVVKKLEKIQNKMTKAADSITTITILIAAFNAIVTAFEILVTAATLALNFFTSVFSSAGLEKVINDSIAKAQKFILKYTEVIKGFTGKCLKVLNNIMIIFNLIPKIIKLFQTLINMIIGYLALIERLFSQYIQGCIPQGDLVTETLNSDGTKSLTTNLELLNNFINSNLNETIYGSDGSISRNPNIYGNYTYDQGDNRIYKPKKN